MAEIRKPNGATRPAKRRGIGPGSGNGTTAGKGTKGQNARSGGGVRPGFEGGQMPLYRRIARRGFNNSRFRHEVEEVSIAQLERGFEDGQTVTIAELIERGIVDSSVWDVKILANGQLKKNLKLEGLRVSAGAKGKIEAAGGSVSEV